MRTNCGGLAGAGGPHRRQQAARQRGPVAQGGPGSGGVSTSPVVSLLLLPLVLLLLLGSRCLQVRLPAPRPKAPKAELDNWIALVRTRFHHFRGSRPAGLPALLRFEPLARSPARHGASSREQGSAAWAQASDVGVREVRPHGQLGLPGGLRLRGQGARWCGQEPRRRARPTRSSRRAVVGLTKGRVAEGGCRPYRSHHGPA